MPSQKEQTPRQKQMLDFIVRFVEDRGMPPTIRDIRDGCRISSTSVVNYNLLRLERNGHLKRRPGAARGIELLDELTGLPATASAVPVPVVGVIAAGQPMPALSAVGGRADGLDCVGVAPALRRKHGRLYALRAQGTSMVDALVDEGDVVVVAPDAAADNGDLVVAWLRKEEEAVLKKVYRDDGGELVRLQAASGAADPLYVAADNLEILGKVVEVVRRF